MPHYNERVVLIQFIKQGFSLPAHLFVRDLLRYYRAQLHHLTPNGVAHIACFITPCESFLGTEPYWGSWKNIFCAKPRTVKSKGPLQLSDGIRFQTKSSVGYFEMKWSETVKRWQETWFYCNDQCTPDGGDRLPPYTAAPADWHTGWKTKMPREEVADGKCLMNKIGDLQVRGLTGNDLATTWVSRRIQPLQARLTPMWQYSGIDDLTRMSPEELEDLEFEFKMKHLTQVPENICRQGLVLPLCAARPPVALRFPSLAFN